MADAGPSGAWLRAWSAAGHVLQPVAPAILRRRLTRGKEDPARWREKLGEATLPRGEGRLVWLNAVGLGEVLALRGLVSEMATLAPDLSFLLTSTARSSAAAAARNMPERTVHQFLPLDLPGPRRRFLDHWRPDLSVWAEQDLWPGLVSETARRGIPLALVNARMNADAYHRRLRARGLYAPLLRAFRLIAAQDADTARHLEALGAPSPVAIAGSLKPAAPALADDPAERARLAGLIGARPIWLAASTHAEDEAAAIEAHSARLEAEPDALLIIAPRYPDRGDEITAACRKRVLISARRSIGEFPTGETAVYIADTIGEMGLWYRLAPAALVGGSFGNVDGHNPWEAVRLDCAVLHGPRTGNFSTDYLTLDRDGGARMVRSGADLAQALSDPTLEDTKANARRLAEASVTATRGLARELVALLP